ncbi:MULTISPECIES: hypothetical protein [Desulfovibrio]|uniref:Thioredoxin-like fold domain-containing protein n=2 Tax=Desulfovibrio TaxID=872 RepID=A0AA94HTM8_DESDE|nr:MULTISPECIES: hypothetical protein [Desulfovibrio]ATD81173.1 hypothetical protein CNY67_07100 [Desulfovibrio sp. G11]MDY0203615.1 hypothetical protein [Desulfovibrio desulfuricans]SFW57108.1 hypothetical protein SAMN02910291_01893 [Desulfovibrio desulfuricans]SPD36796.1 Prokaryotic membrane lipoprotein lipid attachment site profile [Desulfovibrio sp. G11]
MRGLLMTMLCAAMLLAGCGAGSGGHAAGGAVSLSPTVQNGNTNQYNPHLHQNMPNMRSATAEGAAMLQKMGGSVPTIEGEAAHRPQWKHEVYPVVFGDPTAPHEVLVLLDFAAPQSEKVWQAVVDASRSLSPQQCKIAVFANSKEYYGTDLMGLAIWITHSRPGQAMPYLTYALGQWNKVKAEQKSTRGRAVPFQNEYDATVKNTDYPIHYAYLSHLRPPVPASQELSVARYCYDAGNVNLYQAEQISRYYGIKNLPAVIVDGQALSSVSAASILKALQ